MKIKIETIITTLKVLLYQANEAKVLQLLNL